MTDMLLNSAPGRTQSWRDAISRLLRRRRAVTPAPAPMPRVERLFVVIDRSVLDARVGEPATADVDAREGELAAQLRQTIGDRFFASAQQVGGVYQELRRVQPDAVRRWARLVERDRTDGLPVYDQPGRPLGRAYPWLQPCDATDDLLYRVRPQRFGFLPRWAKASLADRSLVQEIGEILAGWRESLADARFRQLAYASNLVVFQRVLACLWGWTFLAAAPHPARSTRLELELLAVVESDVSFLAPRLGDSYPNNHLLVDRFAAWFIAQVLPEFGGSDSDPDRDPLHQAWLDELDRQVYPDGTSFEHSLHYHELATDLVSAYRLLMRRAGRIPPQWISGRHSRMIDFQQAFTRTTQVQAVGDAVEDPVFPLDDEQCWTTSNHQPIRRFLDADGPPSRTLCEPAGVCERATWLTGTLCRRDPTLPDESAGMRRFPDGGYFVIENVLGPSAIFRSGPNPERRSTGGHCKADLLSLLVRLGEVPFVVEAGTFTYRAAQRVRGFAPRSYFMGPESHNGLAIPGVDPLGEVRADFRAHRIEVGAHTRWAVESEGLSWVEAVIQGGGPYDGHRRGIIAAGDRFLVVYDVPTPAVASTGAFYAFQLAPEVSPTLDPQRRVVRLEARDAALSICHAGAVLDPVILVGSADPTGGWVSPSYGELLPAPQLRYRLDSPAAAAFAIGSGVTAASVASTVDGGGAFSIRVQVGTQVHDLEIRSCEGSASDVGIPGDGPCRLVWRNADGARVVLESAAGAAEHG